MTSDQPNDAEVGEQRRAAAAAEKRLLKQEFAAQRKVRRAKDRLERAGDKLRKSQARYDRRLQALADAEAEFDAAQQARAAGPGFPTAGPEPSADWAVPPASDASDAPSSPS